MVLIVLGFAVGGVLGGIGSPATSLTDVARRRLEVLSFFLWALVLGGVAIHRLWNRLARRGWVLALTARQAVLMVGLWSMGSMVVLIMVSGARELMIPGAWGRHGVVRALSAPDRAAALVERGRTLALEQLRSALWRHAAAHGGEFPANELDPEGGTARWQSFDPEGRPFIFLPGRRADLGADPVAFEPATFGPERRVLLSNGEIVGRDVRSLKP
jgi:hypothetical protein